MNVLSLFDGISCGQVALERAGIKPTIYYASEIEKSAMRITMRNYPNTMQLGDVRHVRQLAEAGVFGHSGIDMLIGGSPCQGFSRTGKRLGFDDPRSQLLFDYVAIKQRLKPRWFLLENVVMRPADMAIVTALLEVEPLVIDSQLLSAQRRVRAYWTNINVSPIVDRCISIADFWPDRPYKIYRKDTPDRPRTVQNKASCLHGATGNSGGNHSQMDVVVFDGIQPPVPVGSSRIDIHSDERCRRYTMAECERLQTLPIGYTNGESWKAAYAGVANGWTVDVIAHIMRGVHA